MKIPLCLFAFTFALASRAASPVDQLRNQAAEIVARDRKGEPAEVILEKTLSRTPQNPGTKIKTATPPGRNYPSRLELWRRQRQQKSSSANASPTGSASKKSP